MVELLMALCLNIQNPQDAQMCQSSWKAYSMQSEGIQSYEKKEKKVIKKTEKAVVDATGQGVWFLTYGGYRVLVEKKYEIKTDGIVSDYTKFSYDNELYMFSIGWDL